MVDNEKKYIIFLKNSKIKEEFFIICRIKSIYNI